jgi:hypothetical protein
MSTISSFVLPINPVADSGTNMYPDSFGGYSPFPSGAEAELNAFADAMDALRNDDAGCPELGHIGWNSSLLLPVIDAGKVKLYYCEHDAMLGEEPLFIVGIGLLASEEFAVAQRNAALLKRSA